MSESVLTSMITAVVSSGAFIFIYKTLNHNFISKSETKRGNFTKKETGELSVTVERSYFAKFPDARTS